MYWIKYNNTLIAPVSPYPLNVAIRTFRITHLAHIIFLLDLAVVEEQEKPENMSWKSHETDIQASEPLLYR